MPRLKKEVAHKIIRDDVMTAVAVAERGLSTISTVAPPAALLLYTFVRIYEPVKSGLNPWDTTKERLLAITLPIASFLGFFYQGLQGAVGAALTATIAALVAPMRFNKQPDGTNRLDIVDALWLASFLPLILGVVRHEPIERAGVLGL